MVDSSCSCPFDTLLTFNLLGCELSDFDRGTLTIRATRRTRPLHIHIRHSLETRLREAPRCRVVTNSEQNCPDGSTAIEGCDNLTGTTLGQSSTGRKKASRGGTRVPCEIPVFVTSLDPQHPFSRPCQVILANMGGCAVRSPQPVPTGTVVQLNDLPSKKEVAARVVNCISLGEYEKLWLLGLALDEPANVWGIDPEPEDWKQEA